MSTHKVFWCSTPAQYAHWSDLNSRIQIQDRASNFCDDCTREYSEKMQAEGRCARPPLVLGVPFKPPTS